MALAACSSPQRPHFGTGTIPQGTSTTEGDPGEPPVSTPTTNGIPKTTAPLTAADAIQHTTIALRGTVELSGTYDVPLIAVRGCLGVGATGTASLGSDATLNDRVYDVPFPPSARIGTHTLEASVQIPVYPGPGSYGGEKVAASEILPDADAQNEEINQFAPATTVGTMTTGPDGSGSFVFAGWMDPLGNPESGEIHWTCTNGA